MQFKFVAPLAERLTTDSKSPSEWCPTVADHFYWRITKVSLDYFPPRPRRDHRYTADSVPYLPQQDKVFHLVDFIGTLAGFENIPKNLEEWRKTAGKVVKPQRVYLNRADRSPLGRYFEAFDPVNISLRMLPSFRPLCCHQTIPLFCGPEPAVGLYYLLRIISNETWLF